MAFGSVNTNPGAFIALQNLSQTSRDLSEVQNRISTGFAVAGVKDDSSTFIIAQNQRADLGGLNAIQESLDRATSTLDVAINAAETVSDLLVEAREVAVKASDTGLDTDSRTALNNDFSAIVSQIDSVVGSADFNGNNIIKDSPNNISAVIGLDNSGNTSTIDVTGVDLTTDSTSATTASVTVGGDVTISDSAVSGIATATDFNAFFDGTLASAIETQGLDADNVVTSGAFDFDAAGSGVTITEGGATDTATFRIGDATVTVTGSFATASNQTTDFQSFLGTGSNTIDDISVTGNQTVTNGDGSGTTLTNVTVNSLDLTNDQQRDAAITVVDNFLQNVNNALANFGATARQFELQNEFSAKLSDTIEEGIGNLVDADLSRESARLQSLQVKQQLGLQALSIANQTPSTVLSLFR